MAIETTAIPTFWAEIYIGSWENYNGPQINEGRVVDAINTYQFNAKENRRGCVTIEHLAYTFQGYYEYGYRIGIKNYPRFPLKKEDLKEFALALGGFLHGHLNQNRVSVVMPDETVMFGSKE